ncbi:MAG: prephenate/arogenate dehydrogenase family protein [Alphaproteobacteria bacterium]|nr:prephenate/arogenate dehydrogenase family protein [Alphaproteobacteria bacterium]
MADEFLFDKIAFIGIGLIGSSLARVIRRDGLAGSIVACARTDQTRQAALDLDLADSTTNDVAEAVSDADLVVLCTPIGAYGAIAKQMSASLKPGAIVTDVGSVKRSVIDAVAPHLPTGVHFVPSHPIAGTENSGPEAGFDSLFEDRWLVLTPDEGTDEAAVEQVAELWRRTGSKIERMDPDHHDQVLAITSHVPHLIAYTIVGTATDLEDRLKSEVVKFAASGFRDFTRIAASDPVMWRDIFLNNKEAVLEMLGRLTEDLSGLQRAIRDGDGDGLEALFARTREIRRSVIEAGQHIPPIPPENDAED